MHGTSMQFVQCISLKNANLYGKRSSEMAHITAFISPPPFPTLAATILQRRGHIIKTKQKAFLKTSGKIRGLKERNSNMHISH